MYSSRWDVGIKSFFPTGATRNAIKNYAGIRWDVNTRTYISKKQQTKTASERKARKKKFLKIFNYSVNPSTRDSRLTASEPQKNIGQSNPMVRLANVPGANKNVTPSQLRGKLLNNAGHFCPRTSAEAPTAKATWERQTKATSFKIPKNLTPQDLKLGKLIKASQSRAVTANQI